MVLTKLIKKIVHRISISIFALLEVLGIPRIPAARQVKGEQKK